MEKTPFSEKRDHLITVFSFNTEIYNAPTDVRMLTVCLYSVTICSVQTLISGKQGINLQKNITGSSRGGGQLRT